MENIIEPYFNERRLEKLMQLAEIIESSHALNIKMLDLIDNDTYNRLNAAGLFDYSYIERGHSATKGVLNKPSQMNLIFYFYLSILKDLKAFGMTKVKLLKVKAYLFEEISILNFIEKPVLSLTEGDTKLFTKSIESKDFEDSQIKEALLNKLESGEFYEDLKGKTVSRLFLAIYNLISASHDVQLFVDVNADAMLVDDLELDNQDIKDLAKDSRIIIPLKQYLVNFLTDYSSHAFISKSNLLTEKEIFILNELKRKDIERITIKFHKGEAHVMEIKKLKKIEMQARLSEILLKGGYEDIIIKTQNGTIHYSEQIKKVKL